MLPQNLLKKLISKRYNLNYWLLKIIINRHSKKFQKVNRIMAQCSIKKLSNLYEVEMVRVDFLSQIEKLLFYEPN